MSASKKSPVYGPAFKSRLDLMGIRFAETGGDGSGAGEASAPDPAADLGDAGKQAIDRMKETVRATKSELKAFADLGLTAAEIKAIIDEKNAGKPVDEDAIRTKAQREAAVAATDKFHGKLRESSVREQAATLGFTSPADALALIDKSALGNIDVDDNDEADAPAIKKLLEKLAADKPYLLKPTDTTPGHKDAGIGGIGSGTKPEVQPGQARMRAAYENSAKK